MWERDDGIGYEKGKIFSILLHLLLCRGQSASSFKEKQKQKQDFFPNSTWFDCVFQSLNEIKTWIIKVTCIKTLFIQYAPSVNMLNPWIWRCTIYETLFLEKLTGMKSVSYFWAEWGSSALNM